MTKIGISQRVEVIEAYEERRDCLDQRWGSLLWSLDYVPIPLFNRIEAVDEYLSELDLDGIILTGGNDLATVDAGSNVAPERDSFERELLEVAISRNIPVLGVCRGAQLINVYFGGSLTSIEGHVATTHELSIGATRLHSGSVVTNSYHTYAIEPDDIGEEVQPIAQAQDGTIEWIEHEQYPIRGIMWHPERDSPSESLDRRIIHDSLGNPKQ